MRIKSSERIYLNSNFVDYDIELKKIYLKTYILYTSLVYIDIHPLRVYTHAGGVYTPLCVHTPSAHNPCMFKHRPLLPSTPAST